nr:uncharacterized protein K02A2.6-like [Rhipicephalus microplus]
MEQYPLPRVDHIFANLNGGESFSTLDLRNAYNQLPLDEDSKRLVVLNTHKGLYCFNRLPFGVSSAPAIFQRRMEAVLSGIPDVQVYLDDIIVSEKANDCRILEQVLQCLREHGLRLRREKCKFRQEQVTFLEHCIDRHGLRPKSDNITALLDAPQPTSVRKWILQGWPQYLTESEEQFRPFFQKKDELALNQDLIYWGHRIVVPSAAAGSLLRLLHETHPGMAAMKNLAQTIFWYPGLDADIERRVPAPWPETGWKWSRVHIDYAGPVEGHMLLVVVDAETKWLEAISRRSTTSEATVEALRPIFARFGLPHILVSDNGPQFVSAEFQKFVRMNGINHVTTAPYYPQSNGLAERAVRMIKEGLRKSQGGGTFIKRLSQFLCRYQRTPVKAGKSPSKLLLGYQLRTRLDCCLPSAGGEPRLEERSSTMPFCAGQPVWLRSFHSRPKWLPGVVTSTQGARMATVSTPDGEQRRHVNQLRLRTPKDSNTTQPGGATTSTTTANETSPMPAGMADPTPAGSPPSSQPEAPPPLRRSNRLRRLPQRFNW